MPKTSPAPDLHDSDDLVRSIDHSLGRALTTDWRKITVRLGWTGYRHLMALKGLDLGLWPFTRCIGGDAPLKVYRGFALELTRNDINEVGGDNPARGGTSAYAIRIPAGLEHVEPAGSFRRTGKAAGPSWGEPIGVREGDPVEFHHDFA